MSLHNNIIPAWMFEPCHVCRDTLVWDGGPCKECVAALSDELVATHSLKSIGLAMNLVGQCAFEMGGHVWADHAWYKWRGIWGDKDHSCTIALQKCWDYERESGL